MRLKNTSKSDFSISKNILNVKINPKLKEKYKSNISFIDDAFGMGFTPSCVCLFTGEPGAGKSTLMLELADSLMAQGNVVYYNSAEEAEEQISMTCERLNLKNGFIPGSETNVDKIIENCKLIRESNEFKNKQLFLIIDSLQTLETEDSMNPITCLEKLTDYAKETFINIITIGQVNKSGTMAGSQKLKHIVDAMIHLSVYNKPPRNDEPDMRGFRLLQVEKNRFGSNGWTFFLDLTSDGFLEVARIGADSRNVKKSELKKLDEKNQQKEDLKNSLINGGESSEALDSFKEKFEQMKKAMLGN
jgi:DNA repair protein RadA/Sms